MSAEEHALEPLVPVVPFGARVEIFMTMKTTGTIGSIDCT